MIKLTQILEKIANDNVELLLWGANIEAFYLSEFCNENNIAYKVIDKSPQLRQKLFPTDKVYPPEILEGQDRSRSIVVICADEARFSKAISIEAIQLGFTSVITVRQFKCKVSDFLVNNPLLLRSANCDQSSVETTNKIMVLLPKFALGGAENQAVLMAKFLASSDYQVTLVSLASEHTNCSLFMKRLKNLGLRHQNLRSQEVPYCTTSTYLTRDEKNWLYANFSGNGLHHLMGLIEYSFEHRYQFIISLLDHANIVAGLASLLNVVQHSGLFFRSLAPIEFVTPDNTQPFFLKLDTMNALYRHFSGVESISLLANSKPGRESYARWLDIDSDRIHYLPNIVDGPEQTKHTLLADITSPESLHIIGVMRLENEKGPDHFIRVLNMLRDRNVSFTATLVGDGSLRNEIVQMIKQYRLERTVKMTGAIDDPTEIFMSGHLLLHTSKIEGLPNVLLEAQRYRNLVVGTNAGGSREAVAPIYHQYMTNVGDIEGLCQSVMVLLALDERQRHAMLNSGQTFIDESFSGHRFVQNIERLFTTFEAP